MIQKSQKKRKLLAAVVILSFLTGCGSVSTDDPDFAKGDRWIDSDLIGSVSESTEIRLQDDFAAAANKEWILSEGAVIKKGNMEHIADKVNAKKVALLADDSVTGKEAEELKKFGELGMDWKYRDTVGVAPLRPYLDSIDSISSIDDYYNWITDPEKNPLGIAPVSVSTDMQRLKAYPDEVMVIYNCTDLSLGDAKAYYDLLGSNLENKEITDQKVSYILGRLGYADNDIDRILKENYSVEKKLGAITSPDDSDEDAQVKMTDSYEDIVKAAGEYPFDEYMKAWGYDNLKHMAGDKGFLKKVSGICTTENLPGLKSMLKVKYILSAGEYLDRETYDTFEEINKPRSKQEVKQYFTDEDKDNYRLCKSITNSGLVAAMDKLYLEKYIDIEMAEELTKLTKDVIDLYRDEIFPGEDWLSDEGRQECIEKLNAITLNVVYPDLSCVDYSSLNITPKKDGGTYLEAYFESMRYLVKIKAERSGKKFDRTQWFPYVSRISTTDTNSVYMPESNSINIYAGMLEDPAYHKGMSQEELLSGIGAVIGHEITHGFDSNGVHYDKDGIKNTWLPSKDQQKFGDKADKTSSFYSNLKTYKGSGVYTGSTVVGEAVADMGGLKAMLLLAKKEKNFDYDRFFRHYALLWAAQRDFAAEQSLHDTDVHPLAFLRINVDVQQYDEFYETYNVQPEDKMYIDPDKRIAVW